MNYSVLWNDYSHPHLLTAYRGESIFEALATWYEYIYDEVYDDDDFHLVQGDVDYGDKDLDEVEDTLEGFFNDEDVLDFRLCKGCVDPEDFPVWDPQALIEKVKG